MNLYLQRHVKFCLINLSVVAFIGVLLRYKIAFALPFLNQKHVLHGHSHFAFSGWVTHALMILLVNYIKQYKTDRTLEKYKRLLNANFITAYGMLVSFILQGYGIFSILFSILSIANAYCFSFYYWRDLSSVKFSTTGHWWLKASLIFNFMSSFGAFGLAYMMAAKTIHQNWYLAAVYFFLHFQYNGWFFFACMGLAIEIFFLHTPVPVIKKVFWLFAGACIPAYVLSALWLPVPKWLYILVAVAAVAQVIAWWLLLQQIQKQFAFIKSISSKPVRYIILLAGTAFTIKLLLQLGSTIPALSKLAFGFRPVVIGYLHLILLGVITLYILAMLIQENFIPVISKFLYPIKIFIAGIILNELLLMIQGIAAMMYIPIPYINTLLLAAAIVMFIGVTILTCSLKKYCEYNHKIILLKHEHLHE
jgi:hypothetical protein